MIECTSSETSRSDTEQCEEIDCTEEADVTLINNHNGSEHAYCLDHAEEALGLMDQLNVGDPL